MNRKEMIDLLMKPLINKSMDMKSDNECELYDYEIDSQLEEFRVKYGSYSDTQLANMVMINF